MNNKKDYGNFTLEQLSQYAELIIELPKQRQRWLELLIDDSGALKIDLSSPYYWSKVYTMTLQEQIDFTSRLSGMHSSIESIQTSADPQQAGLDAVNKELETIDVDSAPEIEPVAGLKEVIGFNLALCNTFESIRIYGLAINDLVSIASKGDDSALFKAVSADRTVVACPPIADRITLAEIQNDTQFFSELSKALNGPSKKPMAFYGPLRYVLYQLDKDGVLDKMTSKERYDLFCTNLALYPSDNNDAERSLDTFIRRWKKEKST